jgi:cytochrome c553
MVNDLTREPAECLAWPRDAQRSRAVAIGRVLFRSPLLLGGQAARAGLSCASCHRNGRTNPHFHFPGISGEPGTADVTASLMSEKRGDDIFNPKPIPDLGGDPKKLKVKGTPRLRGFIHGLIAEEFSGPEPSPAALDSIAAYVSALSPAACNAGSKIPITLGSRLADVDSAVALAAKVYANGDRETGRDLLAAARSTLGAIDERFQLPGLAASREQLKNASADLFNLQEARSPAMWAKWRRDWPQRKRALRSAEPRSLYNPQVLRKALAGS